jgi:hypothetical protein
VNAEFQWWLLIVGIVIGGALVYLVLADFQSDRQDEEENDVPAESDWEADGPARDDGPVSVGDDAGMQRDGAQGKPTVADVP